MRLAAAAVSLCTSTLLCACQSGGDAGASPEGAPSAIENPLPDSTGWGTHVLTVAEAPDGAIWVGTYGEGIYVSRDGSGTTWEQLRDDDDVGSISWGFVNSIAFAPGEIWYGTVGNGWGVSRDGGRTWTNWTFRLLGPRWQYVAPGGIATVGDTVYIATADGLRISWDDGESYRDVTEENGLPNKYLLGLAVRAREDGPPTIWVKHLRGISESRDGGRSWLPAREIGGEDARRIAVVGLGEQGGGLSFDPCQPNATGELARDVCVWRGAARAYADPGGQAIEPSDREHFWFRRAVGPEDNTRLDQTYTYGSTMGGNFQQHQGVEFNNPEGTSIRAIGDGVVASAGQAEGGSNTVVILHDQRYGDEYVWSTYYHNVDLTVETGDSVKAGDIIAHAGNTGRATNDHLHLEIHTTPGTDPLVVSDPDVRYPPHTRNPQLWLEPLPGTGVIAGRVFDGNGDPVPGARIYGVTKPGPQETPFSFAETYEDRAYPDPLFDEHFAIGDVPAGIHVLGVEIDDQKVWRKVRVAAGKVTEVEFRP